MRKTRAFTLVEMLVVIAIIGIMAGLVVVIFNTVRSKGKDEAIKSNISQLAIDADIWGTKNNNNNNWSGWCSQGAGTNFANLKADIMANNGGTEPICNGTATTWVIAAVMANGNSDVCTDSTGKTTINEFQIDYTGHSSSGYFIGTTTCAGTSI